MLSQGDVLNKMLPLASKTMVKQKSLQKVGNTVKLLIRANKISSVLGGSGNLIGKTTGLKSNLVLMKMGISTLDAASQQDKLGSIISLVMGNVDLLGKGGLVAKKTNPLLKRNSAASWI
jgi:hypothetical protein